ncbi:Chemotaxis response regulator protein-glutamate methylesterase [ANME-1 cluster archaeon GoMg2]|nr:Chemotaxis response regulator protein-glutamate methylesterase [ANME-1 cluster archaeon GoMg2]
MEEATDQNDRTQKVLLIEDNPGDARLIQEMLSEVDGSTFELESAGSLSTGMERLAAGDIDVVLLDLGLPDSSGLDTFITVHAQAPDVPIMMFTGLDDAELAIKAVQEGAQDYLPKNKLDSELLVRTIRYAIERKKTETHIKHLNSVLKATRGVNQLIVMEKDRDTLLQKVCNTLTEARGYDAAWLGFLSDDEAFATVKGSGFSEEVARFCEHVMGGDLPPCIRKALVQKNPLLIVDKPLECGDCFFKDACVGKEAAIIRVAHAGRFFGLLAVLLAPDVTVDEEEKGILEEVAGDIAFGLHDMELDEVRKQAEEHIKHLNSVLKAIRGVNQLIVMEKDSDTLLQKVCNTLTEARGYDAAWLGLLEDGETFATVKGSGFSEDVTRFREHVMGGDHPPCINNALVPKNPLLVVDKPLECGDCFFKDACVGKEAVIIRVEHANRLFGLIAVLRAPDVVVDEEEKELLNEVAGDIAFGLHNMEMEEARKQAEDQIEASLKEKEVLLREIHHRVKNNLQVVSSLLNMQARAAKDKNTIDVLLESRDRINTMALIHTKLYESENLSQINMKGFVDNMLRQLVQSYPVPDTKITQIVQGDDYPFPISVAVPVGLIVNELLSNAFKHAFVNRKEGKIEVSFGASEEGGVSLAISDDGVGLPKGFDINKSKTLGLRLVKILAEDQLQGNLEVIGDKGATFNIEFKIDKIEGI